MKEILWLILTLVRSSKFSVGNISRLKDKDKWNWRDFLKWFILEQVLWRAVSHAKIILKMRVITVPSEVFIQEIPLTRFSESLGFDFVDKDFSKETILKNFRTPKVGKYKLVSFHGGVGIFEVLVIALIYRWKLANLDELFSLDGRYDLKALGLGENYNIIAPGTIVKRVSALFSICSPVISFSMVEKDGKKGKRLSLNLHDLLDPCPGGNHFLFRTK